MQALDEEGYDKITGFNTKGIHKVTQTRFDEEGYDYKGYDEKGFNKYGYNKEGIYVKKDYKLVKRAKPTKENDSLFIYHGTNARGFYRDGTNIFCGAKNCDKKGFRLDGTNIDTGTKYNKYGHDAYGYNKDGFNEYGFNDEGINEYTGTQYDIDGFDKDRVNARGFLATTKKHIKTGTVYDEKGFNITGLWHGKCVYSKETGYNYRGFNVEGIHEITHTKYDPEGYDTDGYTEEGYDREEYDRLGINREGLNNKTGKLDERIIFATEFIESEQSIEKFAKTKQMSANEVKTKIEEIRKSPSIRDKIDEALEVNSDKYIGTMMGKKKQILSGELSIRDFKGIDIIFRLADDDEKKKLDMMLMKEIASHDISILQYKGIFGIKKITPTLPQSIIEKIRMAYVEVRENNGQEIKPLTKAIFSEIDRVKAYTTPYIPRGGEKMGFLEHPGDKSPKMVAITDEYRDIAMQYLNVNDEFICYKTMQSALLQVVKGEIDLAKINRLKDEKELRRLQKEDKELDGVIQMAETVMQQGKEKSIQDVADDTEGPTL